MPRHVVLLLACLALACASEPPPLPAGASAAPAAGDPLPLLLTKLHYAEGAPAEIEVRELRLVAVAREPWRTLDPAAASTERGPVGVIAGRRCHWREGLASGTTTSGSWYLVEDGALVAFDHPGFGVRCARAAAFEPVATDELPLERSLVRYLSQRFEPGEIPGPERLARGERLLAKDRVEDARHELHALDRRIVELERRQTEYETPDPEERASLHREEEALRPVRAKLHHVIREYIAAKGEIR